MTHPREQEVNFLMVFARLKIARAMVQIRNLNMRVIKFLFSLFIAINLAGCSTTINEQWSSGLLKSHALVGLIWDVRNQRFIDTDKFLKSLHEPYLLLGEKHDNPDHHRLQTLVVNHQLKQSRVKGVVFEMLDSSSQAALAITEERLSIEELKKHIGWKDDGWYWPFYAPLIESAYNENIQIFAGNLSDQEVSDVYSNLHLELPDTLSEPSLSRLAKDIDESHCGMLPQSQFPSMLRVQRARDARMAEELASNDHPGQMILIAGNYHVRHDLGVPNYLTKRGSKTVREDIVSVAFLEVSSEKLRAIDYEDGVASQNAWDFIWFTPAITTKDYCASFKTRRTEA